MELTEKYNEPAPYIKRLSWFDWIYGLLVLGGVITALKLYGQYMDTYEKGILIFSGCGLVALGWHWKSIRVLTIAFTVISLFSIYLYQGEILNADKNYFLKYLISSQSAIMWMSTLFFMATGGSWLGILIRSDFSARVAQHLTWCAVTAGFTGMMVRWYESYLMGVDVGHIPISNLYEVFILFCIITALLYLYYQTRYATQQIGAFVLPVISAAVGFLLWYTFDRQAHEIQPLIPALQSYWMKIHVPANFIGYGAFSLAAAIAIAYLFSKKGILTSRIPSIEILDDLMYKTIAIGFTFFTIATILGAMWAAEAWGSYWSWDPKETWALIVWLNYAAWLHMRLVKGLRGPILAWWALVGFFVTLFAFLGVNMFLSGLHSYGTL